MFDGLKPVKLEEMLLALRVDADVPDSTAETTIRQALKTTA